MDYLSNKYQINLQNKTYQNKYLLLKETQKIIDRAKAEGFHIPSENKIVGMNVLIREMIKNGIWNKLDDFFQYSYNSGSYFLNNTDFSSNGWGGNRFLMQSNVIEAPDGSLSGAKFIANSMDGSHLLGSANQLKTITAGETITFSLYVKAAEYNKIRLFVYNNYQYFPSVTFNLSTLTYNNYAGGKGYIEDAGNGWYRCSITITAQYTGPSYFVIANLNNFGELSFTGNDVDGIYIWGAQADTGTVAKKFRPDISNFTKINWKNPEGNLATVHGNCSYTNQGWEGNGIDGYIDTHFNPSHTNTNKYQLNDASINLVVHKEYTVPGKSNLTGLTINSNNWIGNADNLSHRINTGYYPDTSVDFSGTGLKSMIRYGEFECSYINRDNLQERQVESNIGYGWDDTQKLFRRLDSYGDAGICCFFAGKSLSYNETQTFRTLYNNFLNKINLPQIA